MIKAKSIFDFMFEGCPVKPIITEKQSYEEQKKRFVEMSYSSKGKLNETDGIDCPECQNRGYFLKFSDGEESYLECKCMKVRKSMKELQNSGLGKLLEKCTFDNFTTSENWQKKMKSLALNYAETDTSEWFYFGGQCGCGKTHICTAVCKELINHGNSLKYMIWRDIDQKLNSCRYKDENGTYDSLTDELKKVDVLYIDDFLKPTEWTESGTPKITSAELRNANTVINLRYFCGKKTIISSEIFLSEYEQLDEGTAGRIKEMCGNFVIQIDRVKNRNQRLKQNLNPYNTYRKL